MNGFGWLWGVACFFLITSSVLGIRANLRASRTLRGQRRFRTAGTLHVTEEWKAATEAEAQRLVADVPTADGDGGSVAYPVYARSCRSSHRRDVSK